MDVLNGASEIDPATRSRLVVDLLIFVGAAFALTWLIVGLYVWNDAAMTRFIGPMKLGAPAFYAAVYAPTLAALVITAARYGRLGISSLFSSVIRLRVRWYWIAISLLAYPLLWLLVALVNTTIGGQLASFDFTPWLVSLPLLLVSGAIIKDPGALGEELGWRGFALPRFLELTDARTASLVLGLIWAIWHLPAFYVGSLSQSAISIPPFVLQVMAFSVFMTWIFVNARGSVLWAGIVPHMMINVTPHAGIRPVGWVFLLVAATILLLGGKHLRGIGRPKAGLPQSTLLRGHTKEE